MELGISTRAPQMARSIYQTQLMINQLHHSQKAPPQHLFQMIQHQALSIHLQIQLMLYHNSRFHLIGQVQISGWSWIVQMLCLDTQRTLQQSPVCLQLFRILTRVFIFVVMEVLALQNHSILRSTEITAIGCCCIRQWLVAHIAWS